MQLRIAFIASLASLAAASNVIEATSKTFDSIVGKGKPALVELCVFFCRAS